MHRDALFWKMLRGELPLPRAAATLGWKFVSYDEPSGELRAEFDASPALTNPMGNIQGGMLSAMLDDCMGPAVYARLAPNRVAVTVESKTNFLSPAKPGRILGIGRVEHARGAIWLASGELTDEAGRILAKATSTFRVGNLRWRGVRVPNFVAKAALKRSFHRYAPVAER
jgi:uncharacterized protein (TIGR00369 family)